MSNPTVSKSLITHNASQKSVVLEQPAQPLASGSYQSAAASISSMAVRGGQQPLADSPNRKRP